MKMHQKVRKSLKTLSLPTPIRKYFSDSEWDMDLSNNTNPFGGGFSDYPDVLQISLKSLYLKTIFAINPPTFATPNLAPDNVLLTAGSLEGIDLVLRAFPESGKDKVCILSPTFSAYAHWALINGLKVEMPPLLGDNRDRIDIDVLIHLNPKILFLCNPNNPTGTLISHKIIQKLCRSLKGFVVVDEAYIEFSDQSSSVFYLNKYPNLIILRTFSKAWGLAGARCGVILADKTIINTLRYIQPPFSVSIPSQEAVRQVLEDPAALFSSWRKIKEMREEMIHELSKMPHVLKVFPSHTNFMMVFLKNFEEALKALRDAKIQVLDCSAEMPQTIRVSIGTEGQNKQFLEVLSALSLRR